jgi:hypothetical protein
VGANVEFAFLLWYEHGGEHQDDDSILIGVYSSEENASAARDRRKDRPGFVARPEGFLISRFEVDKDHWSTGFIRE